MDVKTMKIYYWKDVFTDYTSGIMVVVADNDEVARRILLSKDDTSQICQECKAVDCPRDGDVKPDSLEVYDAKNGWIEPEIHDLDGTPYRYYCYGGA